MNLNVYRNLHHYSLSHQKNSFHKAVKPQLQHLPKLGVIWLHYEVSPQTKRRMDIMNVGSIVDKYFSDTLVEAGIIEDDDYTKVILVSFGFGGIVPEEHVEVTIVEIEKRKKDNMRILLDQQEIEEALNNHLEILGIYGSSSVDLSADDDGNITAEVMMNGEQPSDKPKPKNRGGRPAGSKNKKAPPNAEKTDVSSPTGNGGTVDSGSEKGADKSSKTEPETKTSKAAEDGNSKNLFEDSPSESSKTDPTPETEAAAPEADKPVKKTSSIFDA